jgi:hypothetical protein
MWSFNPSNKEKIMATKLDLTREAKAAIRHHGPNTAQLIKMLNGNDEEDMPSSRHVRWMAAQLLVQRGIAVPGVKIG